MVFNDLKPHKCAVSLYFHCLQGWKRFQIYKFRLNHQCSVSSAYILLVMILQVHISVSSKRFLLWVIFSFKNICGLFCSTSQCIRTFYVKARGGLQTMGVPPILANGNYINHTNWISDAVKPHPFKISVVQFRVYDWIQNKYIYYLDKYSGRIYIYKNLF